MSNDKIKEIQKNTEEFLEQVKDSINNIDTSKVEQLIDETGKGLQNIFDDIFTKDE